MRSHRASYTLLFFLLSFSVASSQVTGVTYKIDPGAIEDTYDCKLVVTAGATTNAITRVQANAQYTIVVPTGSEVTILENHMPLVANAAYTGTVPLQWKLANEMIAPATAVENDYYGIIPNLSPAAFYNDLAEGDEVKLFTVKVKSTDICARSVRPYNVDLDPSSIGMSGADFSNGMTIGSPLQIYQGNEPPQATMKAEMNDLVLCPGECVTLAPTMDCMAYPLRYEWSTGETASEIEICPQSQEVYSLTVTDGYGEVTVTNNQVSIITDPDINCLTSSYDIEKESTVSAYPNPTTDVLTIESQELVQSITIYSLSGRAIVHTVGQGTKVLTTDMSTLPAGLYQVLVVTADGSSIKKILKQ